MSKGTVVVTGAARGIGFAVTAGLLERGYTVAAFDVHADALESLEPRLLRHIVTVAEGALYVAQVDVSNEASVKAAVAELVEALGGISALVNNAGIANAKHGPVEDLSLEQWNRVIGTNLTGAFLMAKHCIPQLREARGSIINIASTRALQSEPDGEPYAASKGGLLSFTHALAMSLGPEIRVNAISPGWIDVRDLRPEAEASSVEHTDLEKSQHAVGRVGSGDDIAGTVAFLLSQEAGFITGQNIIVDGGMTRKMIYMG
ncbi:MAG: SDR family oxidoreductase [Spirochaetaceae bacterium]|nr:MAG: SDR family oxidoreductase [Spirochaetaceae bacterium]